MLGQKGSSYPLFLASCFWFSCSVHPFPSAPPWSDPIKYETSHIPRSTRSPGGGYYLR